MLFAELAVYRSDVANVLLHAAYLGRHVLVGVLQLRCISSICGSLLVSAGLQIGMQYKSGQRKLRYSQSLSIRRHQLSQYQR